MGVVSAWPELMELFCLLEESPLGIPAWNLRSSTDQKGLTHKGFQRERDIESREVTSYPLAARTQGNHRAQPKRWRRKGGALRPEGTATDVVACGDLGELPPARFGGASPRAATGYIRVRESPRGQTLAEYALIFVAMSRVAFAAYQSIEMAPLPSAAV
jgi:hypothetical protein